MKSDTERKMYYNAPLHVRRNHMHAHVSPELRSTVGKRSMLVKTGDKVRVMRGSHKGKEGKVARVSYVKRVVYVEGITLSNAKGEEVLKAIPPSNLMILKSEVSKPPKSKEVSVKKHSTPDKEKEKDKKKSDVSDAKKDPAKKEAKKGDSKTSDKTKKI